MKKIIYSLVMCLSVIGLQSCDKDSEDHSIITHFATLELLGDSKVTVVKGNDYVEPGYVATEGEEDITSKVIVKGNVNVNTAGYYTLSYSVANKDGFATSMDREVLVIDPNAFNSAYWGESFLNANRHYFDAPVVITHISGNQYEIDDLVGGFQWHGLNPGFEPTYDFHLEATLQLNNDNTISLVKTGDWYFSTTVVTLTSGKYDPVTGTVTLNLSYAGNPLLVTLTK